MVVYMDPLGMLRFSALGLQCCGASGFGLGHTHTHTHKASGEYGPTGTVSVIVPA